MFLGITGGGVRHAFAVGEEVVVRIEGVDALGVGSGEPRCRHLPRWTIADVVALTDAGGVAAYVLRFRHDGHTFICRVEERAIEGVA